MLPLSVKQCVVLGLKRIRGSLGVSEVDFPDAALRFPLQRLNFPILQIDFEADSGHGDLDECDRR